PYNVDTSVPLTAMISYQVLPETDAPQVADHDPPVTVPVVVTTVPVGIVTSDAEDVDGEARSRTAQLAV
ncbi:MAG: hypothetical protein ACLQBX_15445, partial [Candidatus Limnocylindrales bacterium]